MSYSVLSVRKAYERECGDNSEEDTPVPIPNTEVKLFSADDTWRGTARESKTLPFSGPMVKRLRHRPFTAVTRVRFPIGSPRRNLFFLIERQVFYCLEKPVLLELQLDSLTGIASKRSLCMRTDSGEGNVQKTGSSCPRLHRSCYGINIKKKQWKKFLDKVIMNTE